MTRGRSLSTAALLLAWLLGVVTSAAAATAPLVAVREYVMGTIAELRVYAAPTHRRAERAVEAALAEIRAIDRLMAVQRADSEISLLNREAARRPVRVDARVMKVLRASLRASRLTHGAFDVTVLPVVRARGFTDGSPHPITPGAAPHVAGYWHIVLDASAGVVRYTDPRTQVDLGGIAKGYALDRARKILRAHGVRSAYLDLGGEIATLGPAPDGERWRIGIRHPRRGGSLLGVLEVGEAAVSTSGDREQYVYEDGRRVGHIVDPRSGRPANALVSATVVSASATMSDALSTAAVVLGAREMQQLFTELAAGGVFAALDGDGRLVLTATPDLAFRTHEG